jgi:hypothetical protein
LLGDAQYPHPDKSRPSVKGQSQIRGLEPKILEFLTGEIGPVAALAAAAVTTT